MRRLSVRNYSKIKEMNISCLVEIEIANQLELWKNRYEIENFYVVKC